MAAGRSIELFALGLRTDGYTPELAGMEFYDSVDTAVAMGKRTASRQPRGLHWLSRTHLNELKLGSRV